MSNFLPRQSFSKWTKELRMAYLAAFFDGEGSIGIYKTAPKENHQNIYYGVRMNIVNTDPTVPRYFEEEFGKRSWLSKYVPQGKNRKPVYQWACTGKLLRVVLLGLYPYVRQKYLQVNVALQFLDYKDKEYKKHMSLWDEKTGFTKYSKNTIAQFDKYYSEMRKLKLRIRDL